MSAARFRSLVAIATAMAPLLSFGRASGQTPDATQESPGDAGAMPGASPAPVTDAGSPDTTPPSPAAPAAPPSPAAPVVPAAAASAAALPPPPPPTETNPEPAPSPSFGRRGQIEVLGDSNVGLSSSTFDGSSATSTNYAFSPSLEYFIAPNVSIGVALRMSFSETKGYGADGSLVETRTTTLAAGPRLGLNVPLGRALSWYPQATLGFEWTQRNEQLVSGTSLSIAGSGLGYPATTQQGPYIDIYAPLLLHATDHFFFGFGPGVFRDFGSVSGGPNIGGQRTEISAGLVVGGYWGGQADPGGPSAPAPPPRRFGDAGEFVFSNDLSLSVSSLSYAGTDSSQHDVAIGGSLDYFVADHLSIGFMTGVSSSYYKGVDATNSTPVTATTSSVSFGPRLGVNFAIGELFSIYPLVALGIGHQVYDESSGPSENEDSAEVVSVSLYLPLLVHPAPHALIGFGPSAYHEVSDAMSSGNDPLAPPQQNRKTTLGAGLVLGGWL